jgi:hypothetical protein
MEQPHTPSESQQLANQLFDSASAEQQKIIAESAPVPPVVTRQRAVQVALVVAIPILFIVLMANFARQPVRSLFAPATPPEMVRQQAQAMLDALVVEIDAFRTDYDELPDTLVEIGMPPRGRWSYTALSSAQYRVQGTLDGQSVSFDSTRPGVKPRAKGP